MSKTDFTSIGREMAYILRHRPKERGVTLDANGWADAERLLGALNMFGYTIDRAGLDQLVREEDKQRFAFNDDGTKIRASQGHSLEVDLNLVPLDPPEVLYHGTASRFLDSIRQNGLTKQNRQYVHLSPTEEIARKVGARHGKPVILRIQTQRMTVAGLQFYRSANGVWLTDSVPTEFIEFPEDNS